MFHNIKFKLAVTISSGFYFEKKMQAELLWQLATLLFGEVERLSQVRWHDDGSALIHRHGGLSL